MPEPDPKGSPLGPWAPEGATEGVRAVVDFLRRPDDNDWHEERGNAARVYLGTLLNWRPGEAPCTVKVEPEDLGSDLRAALLRDIRSLFPWSDSAANVQALCYASASARYGLKDVQLEVVDCLAAGGEFKYANEVAQHVLFVRDRTKRIRIIERMKGYAHDMPTLRNLWAELEAVGEG